MGLFFGWDFLFCGGCAPVLVCVLLGVKRSIFCDKMAVICDVTAFLRFFVGWRVPLSCF